jgi:AhpD family alkylhydroperoxidase
MESRIDYRQFNPEALQALRAIEKYLAGCGLEHKFVHLLKLRASQINGCAYCIDCSIEGARRQADRAAAPALDAWRETPFATIVAGARLDRRSRSSRNMCLTACARRRSISAGDRRSDHLAATINAWNRLAIAAGGTGYRAAKATP